MSQLIIKAHEVVGFSAEMTDKEVSSRVKTETGFSVRRLDNVTLMSLNAVYRLMANNKTSPQLSLYSAAEYMSVELFQSVIQAMENNEAIRPYDFIATVGNAANFYLSKAFNIHGPNIFIGASKHSLLKTAMLAECDMALGHSQQAIIVIWHIDNDSHIGSRERRCHALLIEQATETDEHLPQWRNAVSTSDELLTLAIEGQYPLLIDLQCNVLS